MYPNISVLKVLAHRGTPLELTLTPYPEPEAYTITNGRGESAKVKGFNQEMAIIELQQILRHTPARPASTAPRSRHPRSQTGPTPA